MQKEEREKSQEVLKKKKKKRHGGVRQQSEGHFNANSAGCNKDGNEGGAAASMCQNFITVFSPPFDYKCIDFLPL